jgi:hypothetical protein
VRIEVLVAAVISMVRVSLKSRLNAGHDASEYLVVLGSNLDISLVGGGYVCRGPFVKGTI